MRLRLLLACLLISWMAQPGFCEEEESRPPVWIDVGVYRRDEHGLSAYTRPLAVKGQLDIFPGGRLGELIGSDSRNQIVARDLVWAELTDIVDNRGTIHLRITHHEDKRVGETGEEVRKRSTEYRFRYRATSGKTKRFRIGQQQWVDIRLDWPDPPPPSD